MREGGWCAPAQSSQRHSRVQSPDRERLERAWTGRVRERGGPFLEALDMAEDAVPGVRDLPKSD